MKRLLSILSVLICPLRAAEPQTAPILRIEAGMHTAPIYNISADKAGRLALTVSSDKTARVWELPEGRLLRVLRPPIDEGARGDLYAGALSPEGTLAAVGGGTGYRGDTSVYIFDVSADRLVRRLSGLPNFIFDLAFSAQGRFLAAVFGGGRGLRVWETGTWREIGRDTDYNNCGSQGVDWHGEDRLITTCVDGHLRLYRILKTPSADSLGHSANLALALQSRRRVQGGKQPYSARF